MGLCLALGAPLALAQPAPVQGPGAQPPAEEPTPVQGPDAQPSAEDPNAASPELADPGSARPLTQAPAAAPPHEAASETPPVSGSRPAAVDAPTSPGAVAGVPSEPATTTGTPVTPVVGSTRTEPNSQVATGSNEGLEADQEPEYPKFRPSLRLLTGFEWHREQRVATNGRLETREYGFFLSQVRAQLEGKLTKRVEVEVSAELADAYDAGVVSTSDRPLYIRDAFLNLRAKRYLQLRAGHFKRPLSALEHRNAGDLQVRGRGLTNDLVIEDNAWGSRGLGAQLWGKVKALPLVWAVGAFDPLWAPSSASRPKGMDLLGRVAVEPVRGLTLGINGGLKSLDTPPHDEYQSFFAGGGDIQAESGGFYLLIDGLYAELPLPSSDLEAQTAMGLVALVSYDVKLTPSVVLEPVVLGEYSDASVDHADSESLRAVVGVNTIVHEDLRIMPQVEVVDWLGSPSTLSPTQSLTAYLMLSLSL